MTGHHDNKAGAAYDLKYHRKCLITAERIAISSQKHETMSRLPELISKLELLEMSQAELNFSESNIMDMSTVNAAYYKHSQRK